MTQAPKQPETQPPSDATAWTVRDASELYGVERWGEGAFAVSRRGTMIVMTEGDPDRAIDIDEVVRTLASRGVHTPVLLRFPDLLRRRVARLREAFDRAIAGEQYRGGFVGVYPIKVNQERHVVETIRDAAATHGFGLEAGSKPELLAVLGLTGAHPDMPIVCNGFKDEGYIDLALLASRFGRPIYPVAEKYSELEMIVERATRQNVRPNLGVRAKLSSDGLGRWRGSAGARSKFGLFASELVHAAEMLREHGMLDRLKLVHSHLGSQLSDIRVLKNSVTELAHMYCELRRLGADVDVLDVGGGLAVDYDGTRSNADSSMNYGLDEYAVDIVYRVRSVCDEAGQPHPTIITESGRAMTAHSSVLVVDVPEAIRFEAQSVPTRASVLDDSGETPAPIADLFDAYERVHSDANCLAVYHDASAAHEEMQQLFTLGYVTMPQRAAGEQLFWTIGRAVLDEARRRGEEHDELQSLAHQLCDHYICNMSVFQSLPDAWAIHQVFPIVPLHRLDERPTRSCVLHDITCDSDGRIDQYVTAEGLSPVLPVHPLRAGERYTLGVFLVGAYQEILGDLHNLFGDQHAAHVRLDAHGRLRVDTIVEGDTIREVLEYVQMDPRRLLESIEHDAERAADEGLVTPEEASELRSLARRSFDAYTYLHHDV